VPLPLPILAVISSKQVLGLGSRTHCFLLTAWALLTFSCLAFFVQFRSSQSARGARVECEAVYSIIRYRICRMRLKALKDFYHQKQLVYWEL